MIIDCECMACETDFEVDTDELMEDGSKLECPNCEATADAVLVEELMRVLDEAVQYMLQLRKKFKFSITIETEDVAPSKDIDEQQASRDEKLWDDNEDM